MIDQWHMDSNGRLFNVFAHVFKTVFSCVLFPYIIVYDYPCKFAGGHIFPALELYAYAHLLELLTLEVGGCFS
jgi:hypothetical protein